MSSESVYLVLNYVSSKEDYFPRNKPEHFHLKLGKPLLLTQGRWKVGLCEIAFENVTVAEGQPTPTHYQVDFGYCEGLLIHGKPTNCLRWLPYTNTGHEIFTSPFYVPVHSVYIDTCEMRISPLVATAAAAGEGSFENPLQIKQLETTCITCTLHFKKG